MSQIKISIIIPVFNSEKYIDECIKSLLYQDFSEYEIICINDGSTDNSRKILEQYASKHEHIKVFDKKNEGSGSARNFGLKQAKGKYVLFLDSDDWLEQDTLETLYATAEENNSELVLFNAMEHYTNNKTHERIYHVISDASDFKNFSFDYNNNINLVMNGYHIVCTKLHKLEFIRDYSLEFASRDQFEDVLFHIKSMIFAKRISYCPEILYHYRRNKENSRQNNAIKSKKSLEFFDIFDEVRKFLLNEGLYEKFRINYYKFVINESQNIEHNIDVKYKETFFKKAQKTFINLKIMEDDLKRLPLEYQYFYINILKSDSISDFEKNKKKYAKRMKISKNIIHLKQKIKKIIH